MIVIYVSTSSTVRIISFTITLLKEKKMSKKKKESVIIIMIMTTTTTTIIKPVVSKPNTTLKFSETYPLNLVQRMILVFLGKIPQRSLQNFIF